MFNAIERLAGITRAVDTETGVASQLRHVTGLSLFAMAAWKRMMIGVSALLCLWLTILWAIRL